MQCSQTLKQHKVGISTRFLEVGVSVCDRCDSNSSVSLTGVSPLTEIVSPMSMLLDYSRAAAFLAFSFLMVLIIALFKSVAIY